MFKDKSNFECANMCGGGGRADLSASLGDDALDDGHARLAQRQHVLHARARQQAGHLLHHLQLRRLPQQISCYTSSEYRINNGLGYTSSYNLNAGGRQYKRLKGYPDTPKESNRTCTGTLPPLRRLHIQHGGSAVRGALARTWSSSRAGSSRQTSMSLLWVMARQLAVEPKRCTCPSGHRAFSTCDTCRHKALSFSTLKALLSYPGS